MNTVYPVRQYIVIYLYTVLYDIFKPVSTVLLYWIIIITHLIISQQQLQQQSAACLPARSPTRHQLPACLPGHPPDINCLPACQVTYPTSAACLPARSPTRISGNYLPSPPCHPNTHTTDTWSLAGQHADHARMHTPWVGHWSLQHITL